jgi:hypothetical protein
MMDNWAERKPSIVFDCADIDGMIGGLKVRGVGFTQAQGDAVGHLRCI